VLDILQRLPNHTSAAHQLLWSLTEDVTARGHHTLQSGWEIIAATVATKLDGLSSHVSVNNHP